MGRRRLVVELNEQAAADLAVMCDREQLNKTTVVNRALQVYRLVMDAEDVVLDGERVRLV